MKRGVFTIVTVALVGTGCGSRSSLPAGSERDVTSPDAAPLPVCPVRAEPRINAVGEPAQTEFSPTCPDWGMVASEPCVGLCDNGVIDDCTLTSNSLETCDGTALGALTCEAMGYASGSLACEPWCQFDVWQCSDCAANRDVRACRHLPKDTPFAAFALAASDNLVAVIGDVMGANGIGTGLRARLFDASLEPVATSPCIAFDPIYALAVAPTARGFVFAAWNGEEVRTFSLGGDGTVTASTRFAGLESPALVPTPDGGPLLLVTDVAVWSAIRLDESGAPLWSTPVFGGPGEPARAPDPGVNGVFADGGFLISDAFSTVLRVELDGRVTCLHALAQGASYATLGWDGPHASAVYVAPDGTDTALYWVALDGYGKRAGEPVRLATGESPPLARASLSDGTTLVASFGPYREMDASSAYFPLNARPVDVTWLDRDGQVIEPTAALVTNGLGATSTRLSAMGAEIVAGWIGGTALGWQSRPSWLGLARLAR